MIITLLIMYLFKIRQMQKIEQVMLDLSVILPAPGNLLLNSQEHGLLKKFMTSRWFGLDSQVMFFWICRTPGGLIQARSFKMKRKHSKWKIRVFLVLWIFSLLPPTPASSAPRNQVFGSETLLTTSCSRHQQSAYSARSDRTGNGCKHFRRCKQQCCKAC